MKILSWNYRGLGNPRAVQALLRPILIKNPSLVFIMEKKLKENGVMRIKNKTCFTNCMFVDCACSGRDREGGLLLL